MGRVTTWLLILGALLFVIVCSKAAWSALSKERKVQHDEVLATESFDELSKRQIALAASIKNLNSTRGIEEEIRKRFPVAKEGEEVISIVDRGLLSDGNSHAETQGFWKNIESWFSSFLLE